ncbi:MAG: hypothetical protein LBL00_08350, partial [Endomicrobium sp.]|nr:hypothetical protein [Endomicrobium sp.]
LYLIYIPLARRINDINLFEDIRNLLFYQTQPKLYLKMLQILEEHVSTELSYSQYAGMLGDLEKKINSVLKESKIGNLEIHTRVKSIYSLFEKLASSRRGEGVNWNDDEEIKKKIREKIRDIYGFHIVVDRNDMEKTINAVESVFSGSQLGIKKDFYTLTKDKNGNPDRKFDYDISKGFARVKYTYELNGVAVGEIIIYSKEEYENEHNGLITRADPEIDETSSTESVKKAKNSFILTFPLAHWIYKMGEKIINNLKYADSIFKMRLAYNQLFDNDEESFEEIKKIVGAPDFYFYSDDIILDNNTEDTLRKILKKMNDKRIFIIEKPDGSYFPLRLSMGSYSYYEILAFAGLDAEKDYILTVKDADGKEKEVDREGKKYAALPSFMKLTEKKGENPFDADFDIASFNSLRARVLASLRGKPLESVTPGEYFSRFSQEDMESIEVYSNSLGLSNIKELYYAEQNSSLSKYVNKEELEAFVKKRRDRVFEIRRTLSIENNGQQTEESEMLEVLERFGQSVYAMGDANKGEVVYKIVYSGNSDKLQDMIDAFKEKGFSVITFEAKKGEKVSSQRRKVYMEALQALGRNINALIGEIKSASSASAVLATKLLIAMFNDSEVKRTLDNLFYDENLLIMKVEAAELLSSVQSILSAEDAKYENYDFDLKISNNENLIKDSDTYAFASLSEEEGRVTLYINEVFLKAIKNMEESERLFYLRQLAIHEGTERASLLNGKAGNYEEFHRSLHMSNPDQAKLMEFAAKVAKDEMERRNREQIAAEVASKLTYSDELSADDPADFVLIAGNDEIVTFEKALDLYAGGLAKEIVIAGGVGRLILPLIKRAVERGIQIPLSNGTVVSAPQQYEAFSVEELRQLVTLTEADMIEMILLSIAADRGISDVRIKKEVRSTNTRENFDNDVVKNLIEEIKSSKDGKPVRIAYMQTPMQQLRTQATFNAVFKNEILNGSVKG